MEKMVITYLVHATTFDNENGRDTGWNQGQLSPLGIRQARQLQSQVNKKFDIIISSDLKRAMDTAILAFGGSCKIIKDARLREANYGILNGAYENEFGDRIRYIDTPFPGGESLLQVEARMRSLLNDVKIKYYGKRVGFISHKNPQLALDVICKGISWEEAMAQDWRHTKSWQPGWTYEF